MSKVIAYFDCNGGECYINIEADRLVEKDGFVRVFNKSECVAMLKSSMVKALWKSEKVEK